MSAAPRLRTVSADPLFSAENDVRAITDKLAMVADYLSSGAALSEGEVRAVDRLIREALSSARNVEAAWNGHYGCKP